MTNKQTRQSLILELVDAHAVASQDELVQRLAERGVKATQATISRDIRELGLVRASGEDGVRYALPGSLADEGDNPRLGTLLPQLFARIDGVGELVVLHTLRSGAQPIAEAIDQEEWEEVLGTIAGDDTILIVCRSGEARKELITRLLGLAGR